MDQVLYRMDLFEPFVEAPFTMLCDGLVQESVIYSTLIY